MYNGIVNVYKEAGYTSFDVVARLRGIFGQKKIGHTGTLDPDAVGVLPVCLGSATKLVDSMMDKVKVYEAVMLLGTTTDTEDTSGTILSENPVTVTEKQISECISSFIGTINQVPPMYSALKVNGQKLYELARKGVEVERKARPVEIFSIDNVEINIPYVTMTVTCGKGTYIRSLCRDIGEKLGCGACMDKLTRTRVSQYVIEDALKIDEISNLKAEGKLDEAITCIDSFFMELKRVDVLPEGAKYVHNGNRFPTAVAKCESEPENLERVRVYHLGDFYGIYRYDNEDGGYFPEKIFADRELLSGNN